MENKNIDQLTEELHNAVTQTSDENIFILKWRVLSTTEQKKETHQSVAFYGNLNDFMQSLAKAGIEDPSIGIAIVLASKMIMEETIV